MVFKILGILSLGIWQRPAGPTKTQKNTQIFTIVSILNIHVFSGFITHRRARIPTINGNI
jgi:hypothetical protein